MCPQCEVINNARIAAMRQEVDQQYGKVSPEEYIDRLTKYNEFVAARQAESLREDYELGIYGSLFCISYSASCKACGFAKTFVYEEEVQLRK